jgi:GT2 family glycosyltransferase
MSRQVTVVVLGYNSKTYLEAGLLDLLVERSRYQGDRAAVVFVDNASTDGTAELVRRQHPEVQVLRCLHNTLYCTGMNIGLQYAYRRFGSDYLVLVDHDYLVEEGYLEHLVNFMAHHPEAGTCQSLTRRIDEPSAVYSAGHRYDQDGACTPIDELPSTADDHVETVSSSIAASIFRSRALARVGLLDPIFRMYFESSDISFRLHAAGYRTYCHLRAIAYQEGHLHRGYRHHNWFYVWRNRPIFWAKHDRVMLERVRRHYQDLLGTIARAQDRVAYLEPEHEADETRRRAMVEGLRIAEWIVANRPRPEVRLGDFSKTSAIRLTGAAETGA